jgi:hypothetical protein
LPNDFDYEEVLEKYRQHLLENYDLDEDEDEVLNRLQKIKNKGNKK